MINVTAFLLCPPADSFGHSGVPQSSGTGPISASLDLAAEGVHGPWTSPNLSPTPALLFPPPCMCGNKSDKNQQLQLKPSRLNNNGKVIELN
jgi:hypothetical protein